MAAKTRKKFDGKWRGFMDVPLTSEMKEQCLAWDSDGMSCEEQQEYFARSGYKLTYSWNEKTQSIICSATGNELAGDNAGYTLSAHAKTLAQATFVLYFKHVVVCETDWNKAGVYQHDEDFG